MSISVINQNMSVSNIKKSRGTNCDKKTNKLIYWHPVPSSCTISAFPEVDVVASASCEISEQPRFWPDEEVGCVCRSAPSKIP